MFLHQFSCGTDHIIAHPWWFWIPTFFLERKWSPIRPPTLQSSWAVPTVESRRKPSSFVSIKHRWTKPHNRTSAVVLDFHVFSRAEVDAYQATHSAILFGPAYRLSLEVNPSTFVTNKHHYIQSDAAVAELCASSYLIEAANHNISPTGCGLCFTRTWLVSY